MFYILSGKKSIYKWTGLIYMRHLIFWVKKQVLVISIYCALYFGWENKYLKQNKTQIYIVVNILDEKTGTYN